MKLYFILILTILSLVESKKCRTSRNWAFCQERGLTEIPDNLSKNTVKLLLQGNSLKNSELMESRLRGFPNLIEINMNGNLLTAVPQNVPAKIEIADFGGNHIVSVSGSSLDKLKFLRVLHLAGNNITSEELDKINLSCPLEELTLDDNELTRFPSNLPQTLTRLSAARNGITSLKVTGALGKLQMLDLSGNRIMSVVSGSFRHLSGLSNLCLDGNLLPDVPDDVPKGLKKLHLSGNEIRFLYESGNGRRGGMEDLGNLQVSQFDVLFFSKTVSLNNIIHVNELFFI